MTLKEYWKALNCHDWFYYFSDDHRAHEAGEHAEKKILAAAKLSPQHGELFEAWRKHVFSGKPWGTKNKPKPQEPSE